MRFAVSITVVAIHSVEEAVVSQPLGHLETLPKREGDGSRLCDVRRSVALAFGVLGPLHGCKLLDRVFHYEPLDILGNSNGCARICRESGVLRISVGELFLYDNAKMENSSRDALVGKRKFGTTVPVPTPALEPPHYAQLCYLAVHHDRRVVRGTAAGFALTASQTSRFKQAQACAILAEKNGVLYTAVQMDKSNEPRKQSARPAFGPILDAFGTRGVIDAVYDALKEVECGCFLVRDNDSTMGAPVDGSSFTNGPILGARADAALQYLLTLPPLQCNPSAALEFKVHSLKPMMLKHAARMVVGPVERHGLGRFSGSAAQKATLVPEPAELKRHRIRCAPKGAKSRLRRRAPVAPLLLDGELPALGSCPGLIILCCFGGTCVNAVEKGVDELC